MDDLINIRNTLRDHDARIQKIESYLKDSSDEEKSNLRKAIPLELRRKIASKIDTIKTVSLVTVVLKFHGNLTKIEQIGILIELGKREAKSLSGGNYNRDIVNKGFVHKVDTVGKEAVYSLTEKGMVEAEKTIEDLQANQHTEV